MGRDGSYSFETWGYINTNLCLAMVLNVELLCKNYINFSINMYYYGVDLNSNNVLDALVPNDHGRILMEGSAR